MKILQIAYSLSSGGGERFVVDLCNRLAENTKNKVTLLITMMNGFQRMLITWENYQPTYVS